MHIPHSRGSRHPDAEKRNNPALSIALTSLLGALIFLVPPMYFSQIGADLEVSASSLGITTTVLLLVGTITALITGPLADRHGNRPLLIAGSLAAAAFLLGHSLAPDRAWLFPAAALGGIAYAILPNLSAAAAGDISREATRRKALGWCSASAALSVTVVAPALAVLARFAGWRSAFALAALLAICGALLVRAEFDRAAGVRVRRGFLSGYGTLLRHPETRKLFAYSILRGICWMGMLTYLGAFLGDHAHYGALAIAVVYATGGSAFFAASLLTPRLMQHQPTRAILTTTQLTMAVLVGMLFLQSRSLAPVLIVMAMLGLVGGFSFVTYATVLTEQTPAGRSTTMSLNGVIANGAATIGGALGGAVLTMADYLALGVVLPVPGLLSALVLYWPLRTAAREVDAVQPVPVAP